MMRGQAALAGGEDKHFVPIWDGKPETFSHFVTEIRWTLNSTKKTERPLLASKIIRKGLQSEHSTLVSLLYKLDPDDFRSEDGVTKLVKFLEKSPLNRQPLPDAGNKIGGYYRRLKRRHQEPIPAFLVREDRTHDEMLKALQRLLRDRELSFDGYETSLSELKTFCGINPEDSVYYGPPEGDDDEDEEEEEEEDEEDEGEQRTPTPRSKGSRRSSKGSGRTSSTKKEEKIREKKIKGKDLLERLMEKGLMPLAALDVIRGWMILEMSTSTDDERRVIKAATQNRLGYQEVKQALLSMFEDRGKGNPFGGKGLYAQEMWDYDEPMSAYHQEDWTWWEDEAWNYYGQEGEWQWQDDEEEEDGNPEEDGPSDDVFVKLQEEQNEWEEQRKEIEAMLADNDRNLTEARKAVAQAAKDRGWGGTVQQRAPRSTSTYPYKGKGKGKPKGKAYLAESANMAKGWSGKGPKGKGKGLGWQSKGKIKKAGPPWATSYHVSMDFSDDDYEEEILAAETKAQSSQPQLGPEESLVDTGATATAGGRDAVQKLCAAIVAARPGTKIDINEAARPYFRYGSGKWGRALFRVTLTWKDVKMSMYALPSEGVPVLVGMRELASLQAYLGCANGRCLINGRRVELRKTTKGHLVMNLLQHAFVEDPAVKAPVEETPATQATTQSTFTTTKRIVNKPDKKVGWKWVPKEAPKLRKQVGFVQNPTYYKYHYMLEMVDLEEGDVEFLQCIASEAVGEQAKHLQVNDDDMEFLLPGSSGNAFDSTSKEGRAWRANRVSARRFAQKFGVRSKRP